MKITVELTEEQVGSIRQYLDTQNKHAIFNHETGQHRRVPMHDGIAGFIADLLHDPLARVYVMFPPKSMAPHFERKHAAEKAFKEAVRPAVTTE